MKLTKFKVLAASAALTLSILGSGCYVKFEVKENPKYNESIKKKNETIEKYKDIMEKFLKYKDLVPGKDYVEGRIFIGFDEGTTKKEANKLIEYENITGELEMLRYYSEVELALVKVPKGQETSYALYFQNMSDETIVEYAELDYILQLQ